MKLKRTFTLLLALALCMSLAACGKTSADKGSGNATDVSTTGTDKYAIGEAFGTDSVECVIDEVKWVTLEDVTSHPSAYAMVGNVKQLEAKDMFPGYSFFGISALNDTMDYPCLVVTFSLKNIGKTDVAPTMDAENFTPYSEVPSYGNISVIYDDGYTFEAEEGFTTALKVLGTPIKEGRIFQLPSQVSENEDKPLEVKVSLPNSNGETEEFFVSVR